MKRGVNPAGREIYKRAFQRFLNHQPEAKMSIGEAVRPYLAAGGRKESPDFVILNGRFPP